METETENTNLIPHGTRVPGRAKQWDYDTTSTGSERLRVLFALAGDYAGRHLTWDGYFTDAAFERTVESLRFCGWEGMDLGAIDGLDKNEVELQVEVEEYTNPETGVTKTYNRIAFVNRAAALYLKKPMDAAQKASFGQRMKGRLLAMGAGQPKPATNGAKASPPSSPAKQDGPPPGHPASLDNVPF